MLYQSILLRVCRKNVKVKSECVVGFNLWGEILRIMRFDFAQGPSTPLRVNLRLRSGQGKSGR